MRTDEQREGDERLCITAADVARFDVPCEGDERCTLRGEHSVLDHLRLGLAEAAGR